MQERFTDISRGNVPSTQSGFRNNHLLSQLRTSSGIGINVGFVFVLKASDGQSGANDPDCLCLLLTTVSNTYCRLIPLPLQDPPSVNGIASYISWFPTDTRQLDPSLQLFSHGLQYFWPMRFSFFRSEQVIVSFDYLAPRGVVLGFWLVQVHKGSTFQQVFMRIENVTVVTD